MRIAAFSVAFLLATAAAAQVPDSAPQVTHTEGATESNVNTRVICRQIGETGSRLTRNRVCMTESAWVEHRRTQRRIVSDSQRGASPTEMTASQGAAALRACGRC